MEVNFYLTGFILFIVFSPGNSIRPKDSLRDEIYDHSKNKTNLNLPFRCTSPLGSSDGNIVLESDDGELTGITTLQWQIGLGETLCYRYTSGQTSSQSSIIQVTYDSIRHVYPISNSYYFKQAQADVQCVCDCPGGTNVCNTHLDGCYGKSNCINFYSTTASSAGCFLTFLKLNSALCCSIQILPQDESLLAGRLRALELSVPNVIATFHVVHRDIEFNVLDSRIYNIDLNTGTSVDWEVSLQLSSAGPSHAIPPGWYVMASEDGILTDSTSGLMGNIPVNGLDEWDLHKLGWFKYKSNINNNDEGDRMDTGHQLKLSFSASVENCLENRHSFKFSGGFIGPHDQLAAARRVEDMFPFVDSVRVWRRQVEVTHRESPLLQLTMQHRNKVDVVMRYDESSLDDFTGILVVDSLSNRYLNLTLVNAKGTIHGIVTGFNSSQVIQVSLFKSDQVAKRVVKLTGILCNKGGQVTVSLRPNTYPKAELEITKTLPCLESNMKEFRNVEIFSKTSTRSLQTVLDQFAQDCLGCSESWERWLNPLNWSSDLWSTTRISITVIMLLISLGVIVVVVKCCMCLTKCK